MSEKKSKNYLQLQEDVENGYQEEEYYWCTEHNCLYTKNCLEHTDCSNATHSLEPMTECSPIDDLEYKQVVEDLNQVVALVTSAQEKLKYNGEEIKQYFLDAVREIQAFRKEVGRILDNAEEQFVKKIATIKEEDTTRVVVAAGKCDVLKLHAQQSLAALQEYRDNGKLDDLYVGIRATQSNMPAMMNEMSGYVDSDLISRYKFKADESILQTLSNLEMLSVRGFSGNIKPGFLCDINVTSEEDGSDCLICGIAVLTNDRVAIADSKNKCVKLIDTTDHKVTARLSLLSKPFDLTAFNSTQLAISLNAGRQLAIVYVTHGTFSNPSFIDLQRCLGVCHRQDGFVGVDQHPGALNIYSMDGTTRSVFNKDADGTFLFEMPRYVATSPDGALVYVTDWKNHSVSCITVGGDLISIYRDDNLKKPYGITVDEAGSVFVSCMDTHAIHQLTPTCKWVRTVLDRHDGLPPCPSCIEYCSRTGRLYVSSRSKLGELKNLLKVFQLN